MWIYLLLLSGLFMGWSLGTNDAANAFGTMVATGGIRYRTATWIIAVMVMFGAVWLGETNIDKLLEIAVDNRVAASEAEAVQAAAEGTLEALRLRSAFGAATVLFCAGTTVFMMSRMRVPVSANQSITGAVIGWGICFTDYGDSAVREKNLAKLSEFALTWILNPLGAALIAFLLVLLVRRILKTRSVSERALQIGYLGAGALASFSIGQNSAASMTAFYYDRTGLGANLLTNARLCAVLGGAAIALGVLTYSKRVMMTVGEEIARIDRVDGFLVIVAMALTVLLMGNRMGIPVSTSQAIVGAAVGAGLAHGGRGAVQLGVLKRIGLSWVISPTAAGLAAYLFAMGIKLFAAM